MHKRICVLIFVSLLLIFSLSLFSCGDGENTPTACTSHTDLNSDGKCDGCGEDIEAELPEKEPCVVCADTDADGKCDECGKEVIVTPTVCNHKDEGYDGKCDLCEEDMQDALSLISLRKTNFNIVIAPGFDGNSMLRIKKLSTDLQNLGVENFVIELTTASTICAGGLVGMPYNNSKINNKFKIKTFQSIVLFNKEILNIIEIDLISILSSRKQRGK